MDPANFRSTGLHLASFVTDPDRIEAVLENPYLFLVGSKSRSAYLVPLPRKVMQACNRS